MDAGTSSKRRVEAPEEGESSGKRQNVTMGTDALDCPVCFLPLRPPTYQLMHNNCHLCSAETTFKRCLGMERLIESVMVPCSNAKYGCADKLTYYQKEGHEKECPNAPCFCPELNCGFAGPTAALLDHFTSMHKRPPTTIR
ncbi:hypothetical protein ACQJBY_073375 [Aegilops geniculata]